MPKRNRTKEQRKQFGPPPTTAAPAATATNAQPAQQVLTKPVIDEQARAARMFAESLSAHEAADRAERERVRAETEQMQRHEVLKSNKQRAADLIKELRGQDRARQRRIEAEAAYRRALAELQEFETGERPHWAPPIAEVDDTELGDTDSTDIDSSDIDSSDTDSSDTHSSDTNSSDNHSSDNHSSDTKATEADPAPAPSSE